MKFDEVLKTCIEKSGCDEQFIRGNHSLMMLCLDLYFMGQSHGMENLNNAILKREKENVALSAVPTTTVS